MWFVANIPGRRYKNAFKFVLQLLILSQTQILDVKNVVLGGLEVVWGVSTDLDVLIHCMDPSTNNSDTIVEKPGGKAA